MFIQLLPDQVSATWDAVKYAAIQANNIKPHEAQDFVNNLLIQILSGNVQCWALVKDEDDKREFYAIVITAYMEDPVYSIKYLLVHSVYGFKPLTLDLIHEAMTTMEDFARKCGCYKLVAMTTDERLLATYRHLGMENEVFVYSKAI